MSGYFNSTGLPGAVVVVAALAAFADFTERGPDGIEVITGGCFDQFLDFGFKGLCLGHELVFFAEGRRFQGCFALVSAGSHKSLPRQRGEHLDYGCIVRKLLFFIRFFPRNHGSHLTHMVTNDGHN